jgi:hypothetical protein
MIKVFLVMLTKGSMLPMELQQLLGGTITGFATDENNQMGSTYANL